MKNWRFNAGFLLVACAWLVPIVAHAGSMMVLGTGNAAGAGFLPNCTGQFVAVNYVPNSNDFITADGFWSAGGSNGPAGPTITTVSDTLPDGTTGNVAQAVFPAITTGTNKTSIIYHTDGNLLSNYPMTFGVWAKVTSGTGSLFQSVSNAATIFNDAAIVNDGAWHFTPVTWTGSSNGAGLINTTMEIGINQFFSTERTTVPSITVELTGAYFAPLGFASAISYSDLKVGGPLAVTSSPPLTATLTKPCPAHVALRDPTKLTAYSGNPLMSGNANEVWAGGALGAGIIQSQFQSGGFYYAFSPQCFPSPPVALVNYTAECLMRSTDGLNWSEVTTNAPYLFLTGSKMYNPVVNAVGSGFTATASGTATWTGGGCATAPVIAVTTNSSGQIATATPSPNNGLGTGSCPVKAQPTGTSWSYSGVGAGSGASFTWSQTVGTQTAPGPIRWQLHPQFLPYGCNDGTTAHTFCVIYTAEDSTLAGHIFVAWASTVDGVYTPLGCAGPGTCGTTVPVTILNAPQTGAGSPGVPTVMNVGGATGTNYIYVYSGRGFGDSGVQYSIFTTPANSATTTSGNTLTYLQNAGFSIITGTDWYAPVSGTTLLDSFIFLNHCGYYEDYFTFENSSVPSPPWPAGSPVGTQLIGEAVSSSPTGPWYQYTHPVYLGGPTDIYGNGGDPAAIELGGQFILTQTYLAPTSPATGGSFALVGLQGTCP